jgi:c-di-GMP-binding flagellar brake protein YcgR
MTNNGSINRRRHERLDVPPMYTAIAVRPADARGYKMEGHAYDLSEGGVQFEVDEALAPGTPVAVRIELPNSVGLDTGDIEPPIVVFGNVVWLDDSEPGPVRQAVAFTRFASEMDRARLVARLDRAKRTRRAA